MKATTKKWVFAGVLTLANVLTDIGLQLQNPEIDFTRPLVGGLIVGAMGRILGAILAAMATSDDLG